jgi:CRP/FNR family transcriptional regulator, cyclic AMP receptor protein
MSENRSKVWYLKQMNLFSAMPPGMAEQMATMVTDTALPKNSFIYLNDEPSANVYFLKEGRVKVASMADDGREIIKAILYPGEMFGELSLVGQGIHTDFAVALDDVVICSVPATAVSNMMMMMPALGLAINASIGNKLLKLERRLESLVFKDVRTRIIEFLVTMAEEHGEEIPTGVAVKHNLTHQDIANLTATSRQTVTTLLNELKEQGIIDMERKRILIKNLKALQSAMLVPQEL